MDGVNDVAVDGSSRLIESVRSYYASGEIPARMSQTSSMVFLAVLLLGVFLLLSYL